MRRVLSILLFNFLFMFECLAIDNLKPLLGVVKVSPVGCYIFDANDTCVGLSQIENDKVLKKKYKKIFNSLITNYNYDRGFYFAFERRDDLYRIAILWNKDKKEYVNFYDEIVSGRRFDGYHIYNKLLSKKEYSIKYIWYSYKKNPRILNDPVPDFITLKSYFTKNSEISFRLLYENNYKFFAKPNGEVLHQINSKTMKNFDMKSKKFPYRYFKGHAFYLKGLDYKVVNDVIWVKVRVPHKSTYTEEVELDKLVEFDVVQSTFDKDVEGWIKLFDENNVMNLR